MHQAEIILAEGQRLFRAVISGNITVVPQAGCELVECHLINGASVRVLKDGVEGEVKIIHCVFEGSST